VRLDEVAIDARDAATGAPIRIVFEHPEVLVSTLGDQSPDPSNEAAYLGTGALLPFARVGIDHGRMLLELQPGSGVRCEPPDGEGTRRIVVPPRDG
jgi:hypothetical protein